MNYLNNVHFPLTTIKMSDNIDKKLSDAAYAGDKALVSQLIEQGAKVDWKVAMFL